MTSVYRRSRLRINIFLPKLLSLLVASLCISCASPMSNRAVGLPASFVKLVNLFGKEAKPSIDTVYYWETMFPGVKKLSHWADVLDSGSIVYLLEDKVELCISYLGHHIMRCEISQVLTIVDDHAKEKYIALISTVTDLRETSWEEEAPCFHFGEKDLIDKISPLFINEHLSPIMGADGGR